MKMLITFPGSNNTGIIVDAQSAGVVAQILSTATPCKSEGHGESERWSPCTSGLEIRFLDDARVAPLSALEASLKAQEQKASSDRWKEYNDHQETKKKLTALEAQIELLKSVTVCTVAEPETEEVDAGNTVIDLTDEF